MPQVDPGQAPGKGQTYGVMQASPPPSPQGNLCFCPDCRPFPSLGWLNGVLLG